MMQLLVAHTKLKMIHKLIQKFDSCVNTDTYAYIIKNISQNTTGHYIKYYFRATCFDSFESSSGPLRNRSKFINVYGALWDPERLQNVVKLLQKCMHFCNNYTTYCKRSGSQSAQ